MFVSITPAAYTTLAAMLDHPHRISDNATSAQYIGTGGIAITRKFDKDLQKRRATGLGKLLNDFAALGNHASTFTETDLHKGWDPMPQPYTHVLPVNWKLIEHPPHLPKNADTTRPNSTNNAWPIFPKEPPLYPPHRIDGPCYILLTPYNFDYLNTSWCDDSGQTEQHDIALHKATIDYFYHIAVWWRIPHRAYALLKANYDNPSRTPPGRNPTLQRATAAIEALALGFLSHPDWKAQPKTKHNDYKLKPGYDNSPSAGRAQDALLSNKAAKPVGILSQLAAHLTQPVPQNNETRQLQIDLSCPIDLISIQRACRRFDQLLKSIDTTSADWPESELGIAHARTLRTLQLLVHGGQEGDQP